MTQVQVGDITLEFPDGMSEEAMSEAIQRHFAPQTGTPQAEAQAAREQAAIRQREAVRPIGGRQSGAVSAFPGQAMEAIGQVGQRAREASLRLAEGDPQVPMGDIMSMATMGIGGSPAGIARALSPVEAARIQTGVTAIPRAVDAGPVGQNIARRFGSAPEKAQEALGQIERAGTAAGGTADPDVVGGVIRDALVRGKERVPPRLQLLADPNRSNSDVVDTLFGMARTGGQNDTVALAQLRKFIPTEHRQGVQEALIQRLGQGPEGFDPAKFVTEWGRLSDRMKNVLFGSGDLKRHLDAIASVSGEAPRLEALQRIPYGKTKAIGGAFVAGHIAGGTPGGALAALGTALPMTLIGRALAKPATAASISHWAKAYSRAVQSPGPQSLSIFNIATRNLNNNLGTDVSPEDVLRGGSQ